MESLLSAILISVLFLLLFKLYLKLTTTWNRSYSCLIGKTTIVTGSNSGVGFCTARDFAKRGAKVILACRHEKRAEEARSKIIETTGNSNVHVIVVDFASLNSVRAAAKEINNKEEEVDVLVNNAGVAGYDNALTKDGLQLLMQVNYFGPFLFTLLLIDLLKKSNSGRIINLLTNSISFSKIDPNDLNRFHGGFFGKTLNYADSKLCSHLFTLELTRRLKNTSVTINSVHPGTTDTDIFRKLPKIGQQVADLLRIFFKTPEEGAQTSIYVSVSKDVKNISGQYFENCKTLKFPNRLKMCTDLEIAKNVWNKSLEHVKLSAVEIDL